MSTEIKKFRGSFAFPYFDHLFDIKWGKGGRLTMSGHEPGAAGLVELREDPGCPGRLVSNPPYLLHYGL